MAFSPGRYLSVNTLTLLGVHYQYVRWECHAFGTQPPSNWHVGKGLKDTLCYSLSAHFLFCLIGVYTLNNNVVEIFIMLIFGVIGFLMRKVGL